MLATSILADAVVRIRSSLFNNFGLDMTHYYSLAMFSFDAMLKFTNVWFENITDPTMYNFLETSVRG
jgi:hypothetical protein